MIDRKALVEELRIREELAQRRRETPKQAFFRRLKAYQATHAGGPLIDLAAQLKAARERARGCLDRQLAGQPLTDEEKTYLERCKERLRIFGLGQ
jgi:hypothetical protein